MKRRALLACLAFALLFPFSAMASVVYYMLAVDEAAMPGFVKNPATLSSSLFASSGPNNLYMDKSWHAIHWLIAANAGKTEKRLSHLIMGGHKVGVKFVYGSPSMHTASEVKQFALLLQNLPLAELRANYRPQAMDEANIYPEDWINAEANTLDFLLGDFARLKAFVMAAAKANKALVYGWS